MPTTHTSSIEERQHAHSLRSRLLVPVAGLMLISLLASTVAFVTGTALTQSQLLRQQIHAEAQRVMKGIDTRVTTLENAAYNLAQEDKKLQEAMQLENTQGGEEAQALLNARAVVVQDRFNTDLLQIYNANGEQRTNLLTGTLFRETSVLDEAGLGDPVVREIANRPLLLIKSEMPDGAGTVILGIDLEEELRDIASRYRLNADLGLNVISATAGNRPIQVATETQSETPFPFDAPNGRGDGIYSQHFDLTLGDAQARLTLIRPTTDITRVTTTGLVVMIASTVVTTLLLLGLSVVITGAIAKPIQELSTAAGAVAKGDLTQRVDTQKLISILRIGDDDELGLLARTFNSMVTELEGLYANLEDKVAARTHELQTAAEVARAVSSSLDLDVVLQMSVHLIRKRLGFYHVALYTIAEGANVAVLREILGGEEAEGRARRVLLHSNTLVGTTAAMHTPCVIQDVEHELRYLETRWPADTRSAAAVPLLIGRTVIGVLEAHSKTTNAFPPEIVNLLNTLADQIAVGLQNAQLYKSEQERRRFAEVLELTGRVVTGSLDMDEVPGRILSMLNALVEYKRGSLWIQEEDQIRAVAHYGYPNEQRIQNAVVPIREGDVFHRLVESRNPLIIDDVTQDSRWKQQPWLPVNKSWLGVPIVAKGEVIGMVSLTRKEPKAFSREDATYVQSFALQAAVALENAKLYNDIARFNEQLEQMVMDRTEELNDAYQTLEKLDKAKSNFISIAAHELRTPLTVVNAYAQMLRQFIQPPHPPTTQRAIDGIVSGSERLHEIVNSMLDIARIDNELINISQTRINVAEIVDYVQANFAEALQARKLTLHTDGLDQLPPLQADRELLYKVFYHLLNNAIKYTPDGGAITISGRVAEDAATSATHVEVCVCDTGIGIDPEQQELIFEKFYQTGEVAFHSSGRTKFKGGGPGLGLSIVRGIVTAHGGRIWVESDGQDEQKCPGASFYIRLPIEQEQGGRVEPTAGRERRAMANASM